MIVLSSPYYDEEDRKALAEAARKPEENKKKEKKFESTLAEFVGKRHAVLLNSGSSALHLSLLALNVKKGDEVIMPSFVCTALLNAVNYVGAKPVIVDIEKENFNTSTRKAKKAISRKTKAIILPHMFGMPAKIDEFLKLKIPIIEDCAQSIGAELKGKRVGSFGQISVFSFYHSKVISTGEGGAIATNSASIAEKIRDLSDYDQREDYKTRYNYKFNPLLAGLGLSQLKKLPFFVRKRREIAEIYREEFCGLKGMLTLPEEIAGRKHIFSKYVVQAKGKGEIARKKMLKQGIKCGKGVFKPLHRYLGFSDKKFPNSAFAAEHAVAIPLYPALKEKEIDYIIEKTKKVFG